MSKQKTPRPRLLLTVSEAASRLSLSYPTMHRLLIKGEIASVKSGWARRVTPQALEAYIARLESEAGI